MMAGQRQRAVSNKVVGDDLTEKTLRRCSESVAGSGNSQCKGSVVGGDLVSF